MNEHFVLEGCICVYFHFHLRIPMCVKKARSQELTLHQVRKQGGRVMRQILLLHPEADLGMLLLEISETPTLTFALHSPFQAGMGDTGNLASIDRVAAMFLCSLATGNEKHGGLGPVLSSLFADNWKCK